MSGRRTFLGNAAAAAVVTKISSLTPFGCATESPETIDPPMSDREKVGLRGLVRTCFEETTSLPKSSKYSTTTEYEYSPDGRLLTIRNTNSDGTGWIKTQTYDPDGRLTKTTWGKVGEPGDESLYAYDGIGRLLSITSRPEKSGRIDFQYDEQGRKTSIQSFDPETLLKAQKTVFAVPAWDAALAGGGVPVGGNIITSYNGKDLPTEVQLRDGQGRIVTRIVRTYDANGRIIEEKQIQENPALYFADRFGLEGRPQPPAAQLEAMNTAMKQMMGGRNGTGTAYSYDAQGRVTEKRERNFVFDKVTTTSYNEHGDKSVEVDATTDNSSFPFGAAFSVDESGTIIPDNRGAKPPKLPDLLFDETKVSYAYEYDSYGNWTEQTVSRSSKLGEASSICHRKLMYY
jgi:YD repeat-containing protein